MLGLYIHIPFCNQICPYCDFCKRVSTDKNKNNYLNALLEEMKLKKIDKYSFDTLYIGGGTPSSLTIEQLDTLFLALEKYIDLKNLKEFTFECNPEDITEKLANILKKYYVTRISIGVQTFTKKLQKIINRYITKSELIEKIDTLKMVGIDNINIDMMFAIPGETMEDLDNDLNTVKSLDIKHVSFYSLILEEHTVFNHLVNKNELTLVDEALETKMYHHLCNELEKIGLNRYETSNFAKKGYQSIHNLIYWNCDEYIALGLSGSSYYASHRFKTTTNLFDYFNGMKNGYIILEEDYFLDNDEKMNEFVILGLRKKEGINQNEFFKRFNIFLKDKFSNIDDLINKGLLVEKEDLIFVPQKYAYITNHIILKII